MAHSFIPHHHHSQFAQNTYTGNFNKHSGYQEHAVHGTYNCCVNHNHETQSHHACSFEEKIILAKFINLSNLFIPSTEIELIGLNENNQSVSDGYKPIQTTGAHYRNIQLRGPPQFS